MEMVERQSIVQRVMEGRAETKPLVFSVENEYDWVELDGTLAARRVFCSEAMKTLQKTRAQAQQVFSKAYQKEREGVSPLSLTVTIWQDAFNRELSDLRKYEVELKKYGEIEIVADKVRSYMELADTSPASAVGFVSAVRSDLSSNYTAQIMRRVEQKLPAIVEGYMPICFKKEKTPRVEALRREVMELVREETEVLSGKAVYLDGAPFLSKKQNKALKKQANIALERTLKSKEAAVIASEQSLEEVNTQIFRALSAVIDIAIKSRVSSDEDNLLDKVPVELLKQEVELTCIKHAKRFIVENCTLATNEFFKNGQSLTRLVEPVWGKYQQQLKEFRTAFIMNEQHKAIIDVKMKALQTIGLPKHLCEAARAFLDATDQRYIEQGVNISYSEVRSSTALFITRLFVRYLEEENQVDSEKEDMALKHRIGTMALDCYTEYTKLVDKGGLEFILSQRLERMKPVGYNFGKVRILLTGLYSTQIEIKGKGDKKTVTKQPLTTSDIGKIREKLEALYLSLGEGVLEEDFLPHAYGLLEKEIKETYAKIIVLKEGEDLDSVTQSSLQFLIQKMEKSYKKAIEELDAAVAPIYAALQKAFLLEKEKQVLQYKELFYENLEELEKKLVGKGVEVELVFTHPYMHRKVKEFEDWMNAQTF